MISILINSLSFKKPLSLDSVFYLAFAVPSSLPSLCHFPHSNLIQNPNANTVTSETSTYSRKQNIAMFSENIFVKCSQPGSSAGGISDVSYLVVEVHEKTPAKTQIIAVKTFVLKELVTFTLLQSRVNPSLPPLTLAVHINSLTLVKLCPLKQSMERMKLIFILVKEESQNFHLVTILPGQLPPAKHSKASKEMILFQLRILIVKILLQLTKQVFYLTCYRTSKMKLFS